MAAGIGRANPGPGAASPRLARTSAAMALSTVLSRVTGFGRVFALAYALGFTRLTDTYNLANTTPNIVFDLVLGGVLAGTLVPVFVEWISVADDDDAWHAISAVATLALGTAAALSAVLAFAAPLVVRLYTLGLTGSAGGDQRALAAVFLRMFAPQVLLYAVVTVLTAVLNSRRRFVAPMITPVLNNLVVIAVFLAVPHVARGLSFSTFRGDARGVALLGFGTTAGVAVQALALAPALRRARTRLRPVWEPRHPAVRRVLRLSGWTAAYVATNHLALWVVLILANRRPGDVSAYQAAYMFFQLPFGVIAVTVMTILQPEMARRWALRDEAGFVASLSAGVRRVAFLLAPAAVWYGVFGRSLLTVVLRHGALASQSARTTGAVLTIFAFGLPAFGVFLFVISAFQSMQNTRAAFRIYCLENGVNIVLALVLYPAAGVRGLAAAFALAYLAGATGAVVDVQRRLGASMGLRAQLARVAAAGVAAALLGIAVDTGATRLLHLPELLRIVGGAAAVGAAYVVAGAVLGCRDAAALVAAGRCRVGALRRR
ncbi:MAG TPA: murein biosynthesis integral membrane protein MurJ [Acidimicrobiales bacterium]|nr:murein biosynthesis integral membrane protein MurJ [Acidimicrobiales bacterium]